MLRLAMRTKSKLLSGKGSLYLTLRLRLINTSSTRIVSRTSYLVPIAHLTFFVPPVAGCLPDQNPKNLHSANDERHRVTNDLVHILSLTHVKATCLKIY